MSFYTGIVQLYRFVTEGRGFMHTQKSDLLQNAFRFETCKLCNKPIAVNKKTCIKKLVINYQSIYNLWGARHEYNHTKV